MTKHANHQPGKPFTVKASRRRGARYHPKPADPRPCARCYRPHRNNGDYCDNHLAYQEPA